MTEEEPPATFRAYREEACGKGKNRRSPESGEESLFVPD
jgi:hypothetical protein